jgi:hypothetical protein
MMNKKISVAINHWDIEFDPYGIIRNPNWIESVYLTEDILQIHNLHSDLIIDIGYYHGIFRNLVIEHKNWQCPVEEYVTNEIGDIEVWLHAAIIKYKDGLP